MSGAIVLHRDELAPTALGHELIGAEHGDVGACFAFVEAPPGRGPALHTHDYVEVLIVLEGQATLRGGAEGRTVGAGDVVIVPAGEPHGFHNSGDGVLRQIDVHLSPRFATAWLEDRASG